MKEFRKWQSTRYNVTLYNVAMKYIRELNNILQKVYPTRAELESALEVVSQDGTLFEYEVNYGGNE